MIYWHHLDRTGIPDMNYDEACEATVTKDEAVREINKHGCDVSEFISEYGDRAEYKGSDVLGWLGY